jgi:hypothetical protein
MENSERKFMTEKETETITPNFVRSLYEDGPHQKLRVMAYWPDGSRDWEDAILTDSGQWIASEIEEEAAARLERILVHRHSAPIKEAK